MKDLTFTIDSESYTYVLKFFNLHSIGFLNYNGKREFYHRPTDTHVNFIAHLKTILLIVFCFPSTDLPVILHHYSQSLELELLT